MRKNLGLIFLIIIMLLTVFGCVFLVWTVRQKLYKNNIPIVDKEILTKLPVNTEAKDKVYKIDDDIDFEIIPIYKEEKKDDNIVNIVLTGLDARNYGEASRSDTIILVSYNKSNKTVKLTSIMRDSYVDIPGKRKTKINPATAYGGTGLLINTLNENFDLDVQNYIEVKFEDFKEIIDVLGGVEVELTQKEINYINMRLHTVDKNYDMGITDEPGLIRLNGTQTLWHCRNRSVGNSDFERTRRQRDVMTALITKNLNIDIAKAIRIIKVLIKHVNTNIPTDTLIDLAKSALVDHSLKIETARIPFDGTYKLSSINGASVVELDLEENTKLLHEFLGYSECD